MIDLIISKAFEAISNSKGGKKAVDEMSEGIWSWLRPLFLKDDPSLVEAMENDHDQDLEAEAKLKLKRKLNNNPDLKEQIKDIISRHDNNTPISKINNITMNNEKGDNIIGKIS